MCVWERERQGDEMGYDGGVEGYSALEKDKCDMTLYCKYNFIDSPSHPTIPYKIYWNQ